MKKKIKFSKKLALLADLQGMSQAELARQLGMQRTNLNLYLQGHKDVHAELLIQILSRLGIDLEQIVNREIARHTNMDLEEKVSLGRALESVLKALGADERDALVGYAAKMAQVSLGARAKSQVRTLKSSLK